MLNLDPSIRLHPTDAYIVPLPIVPDPQPLGELLALAMLHRPNWRERRAVIREAFLSLEGAKVLPVLPHGPDRPQRGRLRGREQPGSPGLRQLQLAVGLRRHRLLDAAEYGRRERRPDQDRQGAARGDSVPGDRDAEPDPGRGRVGLCPNSCSVRSDRYTEAAVRSGLRGFQEDFDLTRQQGLRTVLPIELLNNFRLLNQARREYLDAIVEYNRAQFELYVALGQPPAEHLAHAARPRELPRRVSPARAPGRPRHQRA